MNVFFLSSVCFVLMITLSLSLPRPHQKFNNFQNSQSQNKFELNFSKRKQKIATRFFYYNLTQFPYRKILVSKPKSNFGKNWLQVKHLKNIFGIERGGCRRGGGGSNQNRKKELRNLFRIGIRDHFRVTQNLLTNFRSLVSLHEINLIIAIHIL